MVFACPFYGPDALPDANLEKHWASSFQHTTTTPVGEVASLPSALVLKCQWQIEKNITRTRQITTFNKLPEQNMSCPGQDLSTGTNCEVQTLFYAFLAVAADRGRPFLIAYSNKSKQTRKT